MIRILLPAVLSILPVLSGSTMAAQRNVSGGPLHPEQACFDVQHYALTMTVTPAEKSIRAELTMTAKVTKATKKIFLDLDDGSLEVDSVECTRGEVRKHVAFTHEDGKIQMPLPMRFGVGDVMKVTVRYGGQPRIAPNPPWGGGFTWKKTPAGAHWIATSCQTTGADVWWPCKDHPSDKPAGMDLRITVPKDLYCASNGVLVSDQTRGEARTFHWRVKVPISNYCVALNIAPYVVIEEMFQSISGEKFPVFFFALPENETKARIAFPQFLDHVRHMEELCGPYPFRAEKYAIVETPHLGMEHQTIIAYGNGYRVEKDGYDWLHHHEMCHEWWANLVTCRDWKDMWIHEGIGTYMQALYLEKIRGRSGYLRAMRSKRPTAGAVVAPREVRNSAQIYNTRKHDVYKKGSWVMHTLRWLMKDEAFFVALRRMAYPDPKMEKVKDGSACRLTDTEEIRRIAEKYHGADLGWFFEVYLRQGKLPRILSKQVNSTLSLDWDVPIKVDFPMPIPVLVNGKLIRVPMPKGHGTLEIPANAQVRIDPDMLVLRRTR
jgi:aminopeptidase N